MNTFLNKFVKNYNSLVLFRLYYKNNMEKVNVADLESKIITKKINNKSNKQDYTNEVLCSAIIVLKENIIPTEDPNYFQLKSYLTFGENNNLAFDQPFHTVPIVHLSVGTGFAISDNLVITAKHVIQNNFKLFNSADLSEVTKNQLVFVFNYTDENSNLYVKKEDIFYLDSVFEDSYNDTTNPNDFVIFKVAKSQKIPPKYIGKLETKFSFSKYKIYMAGYPYGLPMIISKNAKIISKYNKDGYYRTDLDALNLDEFKLYLIL